ncbi:preprotein translocase subunit SecY [Acidaminobacter hydrogenoformans]|uniref:Protein translocase subunit SecY n=1 Tax=Acidaminobacter hydrogenoformans DSM 2784 TaxID=1120920 RepID=A0A1G5S6C3_9FIRM|nr:preprotein translocase subunit SecY [Acidaminobacter hydrogenoformans]SCZ81905.1 protein translocase subunit secY/sec61 alpha [Acidaminobacter hydrogenoformans DSM 2784]
MLSTLVNAWKIPDLKKRILYTLMMLVVFRLGSAIPVPGIDKTQLASLFANDSGFLGFFNLISGGAFKNFTIFALGISPYITASIIVNLLQIAFPDSVGAMAKEGEEGKKKLAQYTRYGTVVLALIQATGWSIGLFRPAYINDTPLSIAISVIVLTAGTAFLMYLGEKITENGIGNGISLFIFAGILARVPQSTVTTVLRFLDGQLSIFSILLFVVIALLIIVGIIYIQEGTRKIPVQYAKRVVGRKMYGGQTSYIPMKVNQSGVIPIIFAVSLLMFPMTIAQFFPESSFYEFLRLNFGQSSIIYNILYALLIIFFTYFYTSVIFNPIEVADNMKRNGGFIPGIRPGKPTSEYLERTMSRITIAGAVFLAFIAVLPNIILGFGSLNLAFGGTSLLIAVGVSLETMKQIEAQMVMRHYQGFLK